MRMPSARQHFFAQVPKAEIPRSSFNRSFSLKTTFNSGYLVPIYLDEVVPGDTFNVRMTAFARLATPLRPVMDNMYMETFFFFVPNRLIWSNFQKFMGEQLNPGDSTSYLMPTMTAPAGGYVPPSNWASPTQNELAGALSDYFGIPTRVAGIQHRSDWHRAYNLIWREWFRDENLQNSPVVDLGDGPDTYSNYFLRRRGKRHDYFTSGLPWPQKGPAVQLPLTGNAPVVPDTTLTPLAWKATVSGTSRPIQYSASNGFVPNGGAPGADGTIMTWGSATNAATGGLYADLSAVAAATINQLRQAFQIQRLYERDARGGTRYTEIIMSHFGVMSPDARLQRPEYLGGGSSYVNFNPIAQTSAAASQPTPQGNLAAMATANINGHGFVKSFTEHGVIIGLVSVRADMTYQYGLDRMFSRSTRLDFYWPVFSHLGEQAILNKEIYAQGTSADANVFAYQERFGEMRYRPSMITGKMRSNDPQTLDSWHLAQKFTSLPVLNASFIEENPPVERILAVTTEPHFLLDCFFDQKCARPMPVYSVPGLIDHF
ncbi:major capsid protein [Apis mellifera associated microvirus 8]|nr:major capsid protein [Apis mellifera associated microvirus 8]